MKDSLRFYIRGFGAGIITATVVIAMAGGIKSADDKYSVSAKEEASSGSVLAYTTKTDESKTSDETKTTAESTQENTKESKKNDENAESTATGTEQTTAAAAQGVSVHIQDVYYASQATDILYDAGLITDKQEFNDYMYSNGYSTLIKEGTYNIEPDATYETIAKIITWSD